MFLLVESGLSDSGVERDNVPDIKWHMSESHAGDPRAVALRPRASSRLFQLP